MVNDALARGLAFGEIIDATDFSIAVHPTQQGPQMVGVLYLSVKGPVLGTTIDTCQIILNVAALKSQAVVDEQVRVALEAIRATKSQVLASSNGHN